MRILITNDDGIHGEGLEILADWARKLGEVTVVAPKVEQSAKSHGVEIHRPFEVQEVSFLSGIPAWTVDSTPADCVRFAILGMQQQFDLVLSGINRGLNIGMDIFYSGTVSAIYEAGIQHVPAIAFSTEPTSFETARAWLDPLYKLITTHRMLEMNLLYNINIPLHVNGLRITRQGGPYYSDDFVPIGGSMYRPMGKSIYLDHHDYSIDTDATLHDYISITPLMMDRTNHQAFQALSRLRLD